MIFNTAQSKDFTPRIRNSLGTEYENVENFKLLGVEFVTDARKGLSFDTYINKCIQKGYSNLWVLKRLSEFGVSIERLLETYKLRIRVFVEQNVPLWMYNISQKMSNKIERLQKVALYILLGRNADKDYFVNLSMLDLDTLKDRRDKIAEKFAGKVLKHPQHRKMFQFILSDRTRSGKKILVPWARTQRYARSTVPSLGRVINEKLYNKI